MAISTSSLLSFSLGLLLLCHASLAQLEYSDGRSPWEGSRRLGSQSQCRIERLSAQEPGRAIESEAGRSEFFDESNEQFDCAGVSAVRRTIQPNGLQLPSFSNAPTLFYVIQGRGICGAVFPGCPESYQSFQQSESEQRRESEESQQRMRDQHQQIRHFREGDIIALPAGVSHWWHNNGDSPVVTISVMDTSNTANQLDRNHRQFMLAGSQRQGGQQQYERRESEREGNSGGNILSGFETESLANAMGISKELAEKLKGRNDQRGEIVRVQGRLDVLRPSRSSESREEEEYGYEEEREWRGRRMINGLEQAFCSMRIKENIGDPRRADIYNPSGGRVTTLNSQKLPVLRYLRLSAVRGSLRRNAFVAPHWSVNAHSIMYVLRGSCRCQVVNNRGQTVFNGEVRRGQMLVIPQNFAQLKQATSDDFEWISFETNDNEVASPIVGKASALKGMPEEVLMNSYHISREEARRVKLNRGEEFTVFTPRSSSQQ